MYLFFLNFTCIGLIAPYIVSHIVLSLSNIDFPRFVLTLADNFRVWKLYAMSKKAVEGANLGKSMFYLNLSIECTLG